MYLYHHQCMCVRAHTQTQKKQLEIKDQEAPKFHMLPKIHKINNPGRLVVSSIGCHSTIISKCPDYHLHLIVRNIPSYV